ncbi:unnamed protein product, partial [Adineta ricciae]
NFIQWSLPSIPSTSKPANNAELTRNQLDDLKKKLLPIQQIVISLRPKKKYNLIEYIPDFDVYDDEVNTMSVDEHFPSTTVIDTYDNNLQESLSERLYKEIDEKIIDQSYVVTETKSSNRGQSGTCNLSFDLIISLFLFTTAIAIV